MLICAVKSGYAMLFFSVLIGGVSVHADERLDAIVQKAIDTNKIRQDIPPMREIKGGDFLMGCEATRDALGKACDPTELPAHTATLTPFWIGTHEVTFDQWNACTTCVKKEGHGNRPVSGVSWLEVQVYLTWLKTVTGDASYRLPTEAEWEFSARAGKDNAYPWGQSAACKDASYGRSACNLNTAAEVGSYQPNAWGLFDTSGNVWEWVADCWHGNYQGFPGNGAAWLEGCDNSDLGVLRGGSYVLDAYKVRTASRLPYPKNKRQFTNGFRIAKGVSSP